MLTSFSPFVFCNENMGVSYNDEFKEATISSNVDIYDGMIFAVAYKNNRVVSLDSSSLNVSTGDETIVYFDSFDTTGADEVKIMVWNADTMEPITAATRVSLK